MGEERSFPPAGEPYGTNRRGAPSIGCRRPSTERVQDVNALETPPAIRVSLLVPGVRLDESKALVLHHPLRWRHGGGEGYSRRHSRIARRPWRANALALSLSHAQQIPTPFNHKRPLLFKPPFPRSVD